MTSAHGIKLGPAPRKVRLKASRILPALGICFLALLFSGVGLSVLFMAGLYTATDLFGQPVEGEVVEHKTDHGGEDISYKLKVRYSVGNHTYTRRLSVSSKNYRAISDGERVKLLYLPSLPKQVKFKDFNKNASIAYWVFSLFWNSFVIIIIFGMGREPKRRYGLVKNGVAVEGTIVDKMIMSRESTDEYELHYRYNVGGSPIWDKVTVSEANFEETSIGQSITVLYDGKDPKENLVYELSYFEVAN